MNAEKGFSTFIFMFYNMWQGNISATNCKIIKINDCSWYIIDVHPLFLF